MRWLCKFQGTIKLIFYEDGFRYKNDIFRWLTDNYSIAAQQQQHTVLCKLNIAYACHALCKTLSQLSYHSLYYVDLNEWYFEDVWEQTNGKQHFF